MPSVSTEKLNKVRFKVYSNDRLKKVVFHGKEVYPLYVQVGFDRQTIYFKSYYFDLLSGPQFVMKHITGRKHPVISEVIAKEEQAISYIIENHNDNFSLELFKEKYYWYVRDLLSQMGKEFLDYLYVFFNDEGFNTLASMIKESGNQRSAMVIWEDLQRALKPSLVQKAERNAADYAPPYLPLLAAASKKKEANISTFSVFEWFNPEFQDSFNELISDKFKNYEAKKVKKSIENIIG